MRFVATRLPNGGLSMPSMTTSSWLSASWPPPPNIPGNAWFTSEPMRWTKGGYGARRSGARCSNSRSRQRRDSTIRSPLAVSAPNGPWKSMSWMLGVVAKVGAPPWSAWRRVPTASISSMKTMH